MRKWSHVVIIQRDIHLLLCTYQCIAQNTGSSSGIHMSESNVQYDHIVIFQVGTCMSVVQVNIVCRKYVFRKGHHWETN